MLNYRREIDGLRAVAVLPVIFFHAGFSVFSGGYVGVDVFFVISGYLITSIIISEKELGTFSLINFYERRARRILPALFVVLAACIPFAWLWLLPSDFKDFSQSLVSVSVFMSNILFWLESGYYDTASELKPLLHTWSLAVEEQYYLIFPLLILLIWRFHKRWIVTVLVIIALMSLIAAQWYAYREPDAAFFLLPTRLWELAAGALTALYINSITVIDVSKKLREMLSVLGLVLIGFAVFVYNKSTPFPSLYALAPVVGTVLIILYTSSETFVGRILSSKVFVGIGLISYGAYLWHQPLFAFARHRSLVNPDSVIMILLIMLALILASLSFKFIERPFRRRNFLSRNNIFILAALFSSIFFSIGLMGHYGIIGVQKVSLNWLDGKDIQKEFSGIHVDGTNCSDRDPAQACQLGNPKSDVSLVIVGDSHARVLTEPAYELMSQQGYMLRDLSASGCPFLLGLNVYINGIESQTCNNKFQQKRLEYLKNISQAVVIIHSRFPWYIDGKGFDNTIGGIEMRDEYYVASRREPSIDVRYREFRTALDKTVNEILAIGHKVVIVGGVPSNGWDPISRLYRIEQLNLGSTFADRLQLTDIPISAVNSRNKMTDMAIKSVLSSHKDVVYIDPKDIFCSKKTCSSITEKSILYSNRDHLSYDGAYILFKYILDNIVTNSNISSYKN